MEIAVVAPLVAFVALALVVAILLRRSGALLAASRRDAAFRSAVGEFVARSDGALGAIAARVDAVRRHQLDAALIVPDVEFARVAIAREVEAAQRLPAVAGRPDPRHEIAAELERAVRALDMVAHGCGLIADGTGRSGDLEAQTSIKRGYLNLIHAREAITRTANVATSGSPARLDAGTWSDHTM
ncbi:MAG: hypothetical protein ACYDCI_05895 [Candidatus Limnocylindrales bacterium]